jgi:hypothetical protein
MLCSIAEMKPVFQIGHPAAHDRLVMLLLQIQCIKINTLFLSVHLSVSEFGRKAHVFVNDVP